METTYRLNRSSRLVYWFCIAVCVAGLAVSVIYGVRFTRSIAAGSSSRRTAIAAVGLVSCLVGAGFFVAFAAVVRPRLRYSVTLRDDRVRVYDQMILWEDIQSIDHPARTIGLAFQIMTRDGRTVPVEPVENARDLEDGIRTRLPADRDVAGSNEPGRVVVYDLDRKWRVGLMLTRLLAVCGATVSVLGLATREGAFPELSAAADRMASAVPGLVYVIAIIASYAMLTGVRKLSGYSVAIFERAVRVGGAVAEWKDIRQVEQPGALPGVAFVVRKWDGQALRVYSGTSNTREVEEAIRSKLAGTNV